MEKKIEDYLHLYLGCPCMENGSGRIYFLNTVHENRGVRPTPELRVKDVIRRMYVEEFKLILRPLSSMTEEEGKPVFGIDDYWNFVSNEGFDDRFSNEQFLFLLSNCFDLFDLIPAGLAIDSTTLNPATGQ